MMLFADESVDRPIVERLRQDGHDTLYIAELSPSITDDAVLREANSRHALLLTEDKDFGELVYRLGRVHAGVVLIRLAGLPPSSKAETVAKVLQDHATELDQEKGSGWVLLPGSQTRFGNTALRSSVSRVAPAQEVRQGILCLVRKLGLGTPLHETRFRAWPLHTKRSFPEVCFQTEFGNQAEGFLQQWRAVFISRLLGIDHREALCLSNHEQPCIRTDNRVDGASVS